MTITHDHYPNEDFRPGLMTIPNVGLMFHDPYPHFEKFSPWHPARSWGEGQHGTQLGKVCGRFGMLQSFPLLLKLGFFTRGEDQASIFRLLEVSNITLSFCPFELELSWMLLFSLSRPGYRVPHSREKQLLGCFGRQALVESPTRCTYFVAFVFRDPRGSFCRATKNKE